jgi:hypothetical protein
MVQAPFFTQATNRQMLLNIPKGFQSFPYFLGKGSFTEALDFWVCAFSHRGELMFCQNSKALIAEGFTL